MSNGTVKQYYFNTVNSDVTLDPFYMNHPVYTIIQGQLNISGYHFSQFTGVNNVYVIDSRNNKFYFQETNTGNPILVATVVPGNYTIQTFPAALATAMNAVSVNTYTVTIPTTSPNFGTQVIITSNGNTFIVHAEGDYNMSYETGFTYPSTTFATSQTSNAPLDLSGLKSINIASNSMGANSAFTPGIYYSIIASIPVNTAFGGVIQYMNPNSVFNTSNVSSLQNFSCYLLDERMRPLNLDNDWSCVIKIIIQ